MSTEQTAIYDRLAASTARIIDDIVFLSALIGAGKDAGTIQVKTESLAPLLQNARKNLDDLLIVQREVKEDETSKEFYRQLARQREEIDARIRAERDNEARKANPSLRPEVP
jgi:hypothetical protein